MKKNKHGGARQGSGRPQKDDKLQPVTIYVAPDIRARFKALPKDKRNEARDAFIKFIVDCKPHF